jgi:hypothetical protein
MKENLINKLKLMMSYDMTKTLVENKEINNLIEEEDLNEVNPVATADAAATLKNLGRGGKNIAQDIVATMSRGGKEGEAIHIIGKNNNLIPVKDGNELLNALKAGTIDATNLARVNKGILKSGAVTDVNLLRNIASDAVVEANFVKKYGTEYAKKGEAGARKLLQDNGYTRNAIDEIIKKINSIEGYGKNITKLEKGAQRANQLGKENKALNQELEGANAKVADLEARMASFEKIKSTEEAQAKINIEINNSSNISQGGAAETNSAVQGVKEIAPEAKVVAEESKNVVEGMKPSKWEKFKNIAKKLKTKYWIMLGLAGVGGWYLWKFFKSGTTKPENELFGKCLDDVIDDNGTTIKNTTGGDPVVIVKKTNNSEYDGKGGLWFFNNGRVFMADQTKRGRWSCKGTQTVVAEQGDGNPNTGIGNINISWDGETSPIKKGGGGSSDNGGGGTKTNVNYHDCSTKDFPFEFGCVSPKIAEIQKCLGITPQKGNFGPKTKKGLEDLHYDLTKGITKDAYDKIITACNPTTGSTTGSTVTGTTTGTTVTPVKPQPIVPPPTPAEPVFDKNRLQELLASKNLVKKRKGVIVKWKGPELDGNDYYILDKYLIDKGYIQKKQRETGDKDDEDVTMKYKWKLQGEE